jgi:hypothetical protein
MSAVVVVVVVVGAGPCSCVFLLLLLFRVSSSCCRELGGFLDGMQPGNESIFEEKDKELQTPSFFFPTSLFASLCTLEQDNATAKCFAAVTHIGVFYIAK